MEVLRTAVLEMCRQRKDAFFCPSEVVKVMYPQDWIHFIKEVKEVALQMHQEGLIQISLEDLAFDKPTDLTDHSFFIRGNPSKQPTR
jgi:hypothetical protein